MSVIHIIKIHWEAGKECWILLLCNNYSSSVRVRSAIKAGLKDTKRVSD